MRKFGYVVLVSVAATLAAPVVAETGDTLRAFRSDRQIERFLRRNGAVDQPLPPPPVAIPAPPPMTVPAPAPVAVENDGTIAVTGTAVAQASYESASPVTAVSAERVEGTNITNTQEAGVDEGGIVKVHGRHLVVLRRGRLFTIDTSDGGLRRVDQIDAFPAGDTDPDDAWYDEMLVSDDMVVVIGYSYGRRGTEINRFRIDGAGRLTYLDTHHINSADYYSDRNYASRLVGNRLVVYSPIPIERWRGAWKDSLPAVRRWTGENGRDGDETAGFRRLAPAHRIYMAEPLWGLRDEGSLDTFHAVTICEATSPNFNCTGSAVIGSDSRTFYVSQTAVYVWTSDIELPRREDNVSFLYRLPLDGSPPQAIGAWGGPVDQFSFREDRREGMLNVVVRADSGGDWMWRPEMSQGDTALLRFPLAAFGDGSSSAAKRAYRDLPSGEGRFYNRYVGQHLLYAINAWSDNAQDEQGLRAVPLDGGPIRWVALPHGVTRLDVIGSDGVAIGQDSEGALGFSAIGLNPRTGDAVREDTYLFPKAGEGENRSQAFFYRPDVSDPTGTSGTMALPITRQLDGERYRFLGSGSAIAFLNRTRRQLSPAGTLDANSERAVQDNCIASCVDWYGNARPIFFGNRIFALMGYELVEGRMEGGRIGELRRIDFAPQPVERQDR